MKSISNPTACKFCPFNSTLQKILVFRLTSSEGEKDDGVVAAVVVGLRLSFNDVANKELLDTLW